MATTPMLQLLQGYLKVTADRQQIVTGNMANVDTPGYHTKDINFQLAMQQAMGHTTNVADSENLDNVSEDVEGLPERPDGNNVNVDRESMLMAQTQLQYQMGIQLVKQEFHRLLTAIKDGN